MDELDQRDLERFSPTRRSEAWRASIAPNGERLVGYVGRLAPEKLLPGARFTGMLHGDDLATTIAGLDLLVSTSETETFCQVVQEALASGVPVVAVGVGGPIDLVEQSRTGWLYAAGDLDQMADRVRDLVGHYASAIEDHAHTGPDDLARRHWSTRRLARR